MINGPTGGVEVEVAFVALDPGLTPPTYAYHADAGADLVSAERVARAGFVAVPQLPDSPASRGRSRGTGGHGSTGGLAALVGEGAGLTTDEEQQPA